MKSRNDPSGVLHQMHTSGADLGCSPLVQAGWRKLTPEQRKSIGESAERISWDFNVAVQAVLCQSTQPALQLEALADKICAAVEVELIALGLLRSAVEADMMPRPREQG